MHRMAVYCAGYARAASAGRLGVASSEGRYCNLLEGIVDVYELAMRMRGAFTVPGLRRSCYGSCLNEAGDHYPSREPSGCSSEVLVRGHVSSQWRSSDDGDNDVSHEL